MYIEHTFKQNTLVKYNGINSNVTNEIKFMLNFHGTLTKKSKLRRCKYIIFI